MSTRCSGRGGVSGNPPSPAPPDPASCHMLVTESSRAPDRTSNVLRVGSSFERDKMYPSTHTFTNCCQQGGEERGEEREERRREKKVERRMRNKEERIRKKTGDGRRRKKGEEGRREEERRE